MQKKKTLDYDLIIIGSGTAGSAAFSLAKTYPEKKIAIVESAKWGGSALNETDLPARALLNFSHLFFDARRGARFGLSSSDLSFSYARSQDWRALVAHRAGANSKRPFLAPPPKNLAQKNPSQTPQKSTKKPSSPALVAGRASFVSPFEIVVGEKILSGKNFLISAGSRLNTSGISGVNSATCLSPAEALSLPALPDSVFIVGAGTSGCELANYFAELGVSVSLAEAASRLLPREDEEVGRLIKTYFESVLKIKTYPQSRVLSVSPDNSVTLLRGGKQKTLSASVIILATGYEPALSDLGLASAGVDFTPSGILADDFLRTSARHIFAAGDILGGESSPERAAYEGSLAASNLFSRQKNLRNYEGFIRYTHTSPGVASVGLTEDDCARQGISFNKSVLPLSAVPVSNILDYRLGFAKLLADKKGKILGATVVAPSADIIIQEISTAVRHKFTVENLASTPHVSSSYSELIHELARTLVKSTA